MGQKLEKQLGNGQLMGHLALAKLKETIFLLFLVVELANPFEALSKVMVEAALGKVTKVEFEFQLRVEEIWP